MTKLISLITGAAGGIGRSIAHQLSKSGYHVVLTDHPERHEALVAIKRDIEKTGGDATIHSADISVEKEVDTMIAETAKQLGSLDVMVANAGRCVSKPFLASSCEDYQQIFSVNVMGTYLCYKYAAQQMIKQSRPGGRIIGASSLAGKQAWPLLGLYSSSKFAIRGLTQAVAKELAIHSITVNAYAPGPVDTAMLSIVREDIAKYLPNKGQVAAAIASTISPMGRDTTPEEVASLVSFLVSEEASMITGQTISINGGMYFD